MHGGSSVYSSPQAYVPAVTARVQQDLWYAARLLWARYNQQWSNLTLAFALLSAGVYVVESYDSTQQSNTPLWSKVVEVVIASFFLADYLIRLYISDHRLRFLRTFQSAFDLVCVAPAIFMFVFEERSDPDAEEKHADPRKIVFFLQFLRVVRLIRIMRGYRVVSISKRGDPENLRKQIQILIYTLLALIFITAALLDVVEKHAEIPSLDGEVTSQHIEYFHDAVYLVVITLTTVGYGDIVPRTFIARVIIMFFVVASVILIPRETGKLAELMALTSPYAGAFQNKERLPHVVVGGHIEFANLKAFLTEFFHEAHGQHQIMVLILAPRHPGKSLKLLLGEQGFYGNRVQYFEGSALDATDLERVRVEAAHAVFLLSDRFSTNAVLADCETVMRVLSVKQAAPDVAVYAQVLLPESKPQIITAGADHFVCMLELKMHILATASMVHGFSTLFCNLFRNEDFVCDRERHWLSEYCHGISYEIYSFPIPPIFYGRSFTEVAWLIYSEYGALLFGVKHGRQRCLLNPVAPRGERRYHFTEHDKGIMFATDAAVADDIAAFAGDITPPVTPHHSAAAAAEAFASETPKISESISLKGTPSAVHLGRYESTRGAELTPLAIQSPLTDLLSPMREQPPTTSPMSRPKKCPAGRRGQPPEPLSLPRDRVTSPRERMTDGRRSKGADSVDLPRCGESVVLPPLIPIHPPFTLPAPQLLDPGADAPSESSEGFHPEDKYEECIVPEVSRDMEGHIVLIAPSEVHVLHFIAPLRADSVPAEEMRPIVALVPRVPDRAVLKVLYHLPAISFVLGLPRNVADFSRCNVARAWTCVILFSNAVGDSRLSLACGYDEGDEMMADYDALLAYTCLMSGRDMYSAGGPFSILELVHKQNTRFIPPRPEESFGPITERNDYIVPCYAGGGVYSDAVMDSLLCQVFYNSDLLDVLARFLSPGPLPVLWPPPRYGRCSGQRGDPLAATASVEKEPGFESSRIFSVSMRAAFVGSTFKELLCHMLLCQAQLPIGLFRAPEPDRGEAGGSVPYVFLCPPPETVLRRQDRIFVLASGDPTLAPD
eukprot:TRINITY_DN10823_c0_g1_i1.p1 TRINITY_DN10823_c0_g1~~TRINITY_DN10823_c0_g1_i1.p1  ORF type:complete len:1061 (+),score=300.00 TRINITY_DN10823_c0_g1_i1:106-3288(+)